MFRQLADVLASGTANVGSANTVLTTYRPGQLQEFIEVFWHQGRDSNRQAALGDALNPLVHRAMGRPTRIDPVVFGLPVPAPPSVTWRHLVYAAMLEQTRIVEIFRRVVAEWVSGERLPRASEATQRWVQATEQLFFAPAWQYSVRAVTSTIRPDAGSVRRNIIWRMFGWELQHGTEDGRPYPYVKSETANRDFSAIFEALLTEVWRGYSNALNLVGPNETDDNAIESLVRNLREMLRTRRYAGAISREEFDAVTTLSWFHLTVQFNTVIVNDLAAQSSGVAERLKNIGDRVGLQAHSRSDAYFRLAEPMSNILIAIESGAVPNAQSLYNGAFAADMLEIITNWSIVTGRNVKDPTLRLPVGKVLTAAVRGTVGDLAARDRAALLVR